MGVRSSEPTTGVTIANPAVPFAPPFPNDPGSITTLAAAARDNVPPATSVVRSPAYNATSTWTVSSETFATFRKVVRSARASYKKMSWSPLTLGVPSVGWAIAGAEPIAAKPAMAARVTTARKTPVRLRGRSPLASRTDTRSITSDTP